MVHASAELSEPMGRVDGTNAPDPATVLTRVAEDCDLLTGGGTDSVIRPIHALPVGH